MNEEASEEEKQKQKIKRLIQEGKTEWITANAEDLLARMDPNDPDMWKITAVRLECFGERTRDNGRTFEHQGGFEIFWETKAAGFGTTTVVVENDGTLRCDNETMNRDFIKSVFVALADKLVLDDE